MGFVRGVFKLCPEILTGFPRMARRLPSSIQQPSIIHPSAPPNPTPQGGGVTPGPGPGPYPGPAWEGRKGWGRVGEGSPGSGPNLY